ncbi:uncharacterized protein [Musca autumnalis]|uniref:uncharacterized protein n=1 Tax=Musca autumnalis TaxID=221902 RepID=UPI003CEE8449
MSSENIVKLLAEQQAAMNLQTQLLQQLTNLLQAQSTGNTKDATSPSTSKAALMESLSHSMTDFVYEPESGLIFQAWYNRYQHVFEKEAQSLDDHDKVALLWRKMSNSVHERFRNYVLPKNPTEMSLKDTLEKLNKLFGEDYKEYAGRVNLQCELFKLNEMQVDQFKCLIYVLGLQSSKDNDIRLRLLKLLDEAKDSTTLDTLVDETQRLMDLKTDNTLIEHQSQSICAVKKFAKNNNKHSHKIPKTPCWLCGDMHYSKYCPFKNHKCSKCQQTGHKDNFCKSAKRGKSTTDKTAVKSDKTKYNANAVFSSKQLQFQQLRKYTTVEINKKQVKLQIDTASDISIISRSTWEYIDDLLKKDHKFIWTKECQQSLNEFKRILTSDLLLTHYNPALPIHIAADASSHGIGAVIYHTYPDNSVKAIHHVSRSLTPTERNYSQIEKEGLALVFAVQRFHKMIFGRKFTLHTDHKPLLTIFGSKKGIPVYTANRLQRWALILLTYDFDIKYTNTKDFGHADVLSRLISAHEKPSDEYIIASINLENDIRYDITDAVSTLPVSFKMIQDATKKDSTL